MDGSRCDQRSRRLSRRGFGASLATVIAWLSTSVGAIAAKPQDVCGGEPTSLSRYCAGVRTCMVDSDCAPSCACIERRAGCCYTVRRKKGGRKLRKCVDLKPALFCTPR